MTGLNPSAVGVNWFPPALPIGTPKTQPPPAMQLRRVLPRFLIPGFAVRLLYFWRFGALISPRAEIEYSRQARWGRRCVVSSFTKIKINGPFTAGEGVEIATGCFISVDAGGLVLGNHVLVGPNCAILTSNYSYRELDIPLPAQGSVSKGVSIGNNVWLGANSVVLDGTEIGDNVIVSAGSIVSGIVPRNAVIQGNPAAVIFTRR